MKQSIVKWLFELTPNSVKCWHVDSVCWGTEAATLEDVGREIGLTRERVLG